ncbi:MAG: hypothetical protein WA996_20125 [Candidatus Promineifilaceae bacterium]
MASAPERNPSSNRPRSVTLVAVGVLLLGLANIFRALGLSRQSDLQLELGVSLDPRLRMILAVLWAIILISMAVVLWLRKPVARIAIPVLLTLYAVYRLAIVGIFAESEYARGSQLATAVLYGGAILITIWVLNRKPAKEYFADLEEGQGYDSDLSISSS